MTDAPTPDQTAAAVAGPIGALGTAFMLHPSLYEAGGRIGLPGFDFYFRGRGGVLGEVDADVVLATFGFFGAELLRTNWEAGARVLGAEATATAFLDAACEWAEAHLADEIDHDRVASLARRVAEASDVAGLPLFAGWRAFVATHEPTTPKGRALAWLNVLREHRGSSHVLAAVQTGLDPHAAVVRTYGTGTAEFFGFTAPHPDTDISGTAEATEAITAALAARPYAALTPNERAEFIDLVARVQPT